MIQIAICDDRKEDCDIIQKYVTEYMSCNNMIFQINIFDAGEALLESDLAFDLVFLDIAMPGSNGIQVGRELRSIHKHTLIVFISDFSEYWTQAINNVHAFAYLEKPIERQEVARQLGEALYELERTRQETPEVSFEIITVRNGYITDTEIRSFLITDILYFQYIGRKIMLKTEEREYIFISQMKNVVTRMAPYPFAGCHQNYLVNLQYVQKIRGYELFLKNGEKLPVSQKKSAEFRNKLNQYIQHNL